jgi:hypothetical protein
MPLRWCCRAGPARSIRRVRRCCHATERISRMRAFCTLLINEND